MELQGRVEEIRRQGLGLAAISYDSPEILSDFAKRRSVTYLLLSDPGSAIIKQFGLLNRETKEGTPQYGIPYPGTFILDRTGVVKARFFEQYYRERLTVSTILLRLGQMDSGTGTKISSDQLDIVASAGDEAVAVGNHFSLVFQFTPKQNIHVYAPGVIGYKSLAIHIDPQDVLKLHPITFPPSEEYLFAPLNERVQVYQKPFTVVQDVTIVATQEAQDALKGRESITINGTVDYQACDDKICYNPVSVPVSWTLKLRALDRERVQRE